MEAATFNCFLKSPNYVLPFIPALLNFFPYQRVSSMAFVWKQNEIFDSVLFNRVNHCGVRQVRLQEYPPQPSYYGVNQQYQRAGSCNNFTSVF
jgi:hypothetical protein